MPTPRKPKSEHKRNGRPPFEATDAQRKNVKAMAGYGFAQQDIADTIGISLPSLKKHFKAELKTGAITANAAVAQSLYQKATGTGPQAVTAAIFWAKTRMGWKETAAVEHSGSLQLEDARGKLMNSLTKQLTAEDAAKDE